MSMAPAGQLIGDWSDVPAGQLRAGTSFGPVVLPPPHPPKSLSLVFILPNLPTGFTKCLVTFQHSHYSSLVVKDSELTQDQCVK